MEVCLCHHTYPEAGPVSSCTHANGNSYTLQHDVPGRVHTIPQLPSEYQNPVRNPYGLMPRPPQTQAAHFKPLYRK